MTYGKNINNKGKIEKNSKVKEGECIFPFKHKSKTYNECMPTEKGDICATEVSKHKTLKRYGYCEDYKKRTVKKTPSPKKKTPKLKIITKEEMLKKIDLKNKPNSKSPNKTMSSKKTSEKSYNEEFIKIMEELADIMGRQGEPFKARAYKKASESIMAYNEPIYDAKQVEKLPGIGKTIVEKLVEYQKTGTLKILERERNNPLNVFTNIYGIGPKKAKQLISDGIDTLSKLKENKDKLNDTQKIGLEYYDDLLKRIPRRIQTKDRRSI